MDFRMDMDEETLLSAFEELDIEFTPDEADYRRQRGPGRGYYRGRRGAARTPTDVKELPGKLVFVMDMPGVRPGEIRVRVEEDGNVLCVNAERKREKQEEEEEEESVGKYVRVERRMGKFARKFPLPDDANKDGIDAVYENGVLTITVERLLPPEPKQPRTIEVRAA